MGVKRGVISTALSTLASIATTEAKKNGKFVIPGVVMIKTRQKKATKAGKREIFGKAGQDHRQGFPSESPQGRVLKASRSVPRDEAPRVLFQFLLSLLVHSSLLRGICVSCCPGWLEGAWSCMAFRSQDARRGRSHVLHIFLADKK